MRTALAFLAGIAAAHLWRRLVQPVSDDAGELAARRALRGQQSGGAA